MGLFGQAGFRRRDKYRKHLQRMLGEQHEAGEISDFDYQRAWKASLKNSTIESVIAESRKSGTTDSNLKGEFSWEGIWQWLKDNWWEILKLVLTIAIMFADTEEEKKLFGEEPKRLK